MKHVELASFDVVHEELTWPWPAFDPTGKPFAFADASSRIATRVLDDAGVSSGRSFSLPSDAHVPGLRGFAIDPEGARLALCAESDTETALLLVEAASHALVGISRSAAFPRPSTHELYVHPQDDAVLLVAACGEEGTFARVVGWSGKAVEVVPTALDDGGIPAGFAGFSADAARVHLVEADELRTHAWPTLHELSSVQLAGDFVSSFAGAVLGHHVFVDGHHADDGGEGGDDAVMRFDRSAIRGIVLPPPVPIGMWAGRLGADVIVTVESKGDPARGRVIRVALPDTSN